MPKSEPRLIGFMGPWSEEDALSILQFASDLTGEEIEDFIPIGAVMQEEGIEEDVEVATPHRGES